MASLIMGAWFYMTAVGNFVAGKIGEATGGRRRDDQGKAARDLRAVRLDRDRRGRRGAAGVPLVKKLMHLDTLDAAPAQGSE
jgi:proton-dependent oligopeptide transporter, POT family